MADQKGTITISPGAVVCKEAEIVGDVTIGANTVVHPSVKVLALGGPIVLGESNLLKDSATIVNPRKREDGPRSTLVIGNGNTFDIASYCAAEVVGDCNVFEPRSHIGEGARIPSFCVVGCGCCVLGGEELPPNTVVFGGAQTRYIQSKQVQMQSSHEQQLKALAKMLPNYHKLLKPTTPSAAPVA